MSNKELKIKKIKKKKDTNNIYNIHLKDSNNDNNMANSNDKRLIERGIEKDKNIIRTETRKTNNEQNLINKLKINKCLLCLCFLCFKKRKNLQNILLDEGMGIITQYLDVINIFKKLYRDGKIQEQLQKDKDDIIEMSENCLYKLSKVDQVKCIYLFITFKNIKKYKNIIFLNNNYFYLKFDNNYINYFMKY